MGEALFLRPAPRRPMILKPRWTRHCDDPAKPSVLVAQAVTDARLGRKELRSSRIVFDLAPEVAHVYAQIFNLFGVITPPDFLEALASSEEHTCELQSPM